MSATNLLRAGRIGTGDFDRATTGTGTAAGTGALRHGTTFAAWDLLGYFVRGHGYLQKRGAEAPNREVHMLFIPFRLVCQ